MGGNLRNFINGFSASAREVFEYFNFDDNIDRINDPEADILFRVIKYIQEIGGDLITYKIRLVKL